MRRADAPLAGWYPDPQDRTRLRWWDGLDWTEVRRAVPSAAELTAAEHSAAVATSDRSGGFGSELVAAGRQRAQRPAGGGGQLRRQDAQEIIDEVRNVARAEVDRAAEVFSQRATTAARSFTPLVTEYTTKFLRWVKLALGVAFTIFVLWMVFQFIAQQSLFDWIGDRIDNLTDENGAGLLGPSG